MIGQSKKSNIKLLKVSVITVSMNDVVGLAKTITNVVDQDYENLARCAKETLAIYQKVIN